MFRHIRIEECNRRNSIDLRLIELHTIRVMLLLIELLDIDLETGLPDESHIEEDIMSDEDIFFLQEFREFRHGFKRRRCPLDHLFSNAGKFFCFIGDRKTRIDHRSEYAGLRIIPVFSLFIADRRDLEKSFSGAVQTCRLDIERYEAIQRYIFFADVICDTVTVIDKVTLHAEDQLKARNFALFLAFFISGIRIIKSLHDTMVSDRAGRMTHAVCRFDQILRLDDSIFFTHLRMGMEFDTLFFRKIHTLFRRLRDIESLDRGIDLPVKLTISDGSGNSDISAFSELVIQLVSIFRRWKQNAVHRICIIGKEELIKDHVLILSDQTLRLQIDLDLAFETDDRIRS